MPKAHNFAHEFKVRNYNVYKNREGFKIAKIESI